MTCLREHCPLCLTLKLKSVSSVQSLCCVQLFATPWTVARQASMSITNFWSLLKLVSINNLILCRPFLLLPSVLPNIRVFSNESVLHIRFPNIGASASASVLPMNIQDWFPLGLTGLIALQSKGLSKVFSNTQFKSINSLVLSFLHGPTLTSIHASPQTPALAGPNPTPSHFFYFDHVTEDKIADRNLLFLQHNMLSFSQALFHRKSP